MVQALARHPGGTLDRWQKISEFVVTRNESEVKAMVYKHQSALPSEELCIQAGVIRSHGGKLPKSTAAAWEPPNKQEPKGTVVVESQVDKMIMPKYLRWVIQVDEWSVNQQKALEAALKKYPASDKVSTLATQQLMELSVSDHECWCRRGGTTSQLMLVKLESKS